MWCYLGHLLAWSTLAWNRMVNRSSDNHAHFSKSFCIKHFGRGIESEVTYPLFVEKRVCVFLWFETALTHRCFRLESHLRSYRIPSQLDRMKDMPKWSHSKENPIHWSNWISVSDWILFRFLCSSLIISELNDDKLLFQSCARSTYHYPSLVYNRIDEAKNKRKNLQWIEARVRNDD